ncbi:hypothetical protein [Streptomyces sp. NPDC001137]|uniref:hypothetical protein n=1 Tax=Streptomyces sp. NPDC001137 TaxID=3154378 RepID=UPI00332936CA
MTLAAAGHSLAGHPAPALWAEGVAFATVFALGCPLAGHERSLTGICPAMAAVQVGLHMFFDATSLHTGPATPGAPGSMTASVMTQHGADGRAMTAHAAAALVAAWWLRCGEAAVWSLLRQVATLARGSGLRWPVTVALAEPPSHAVVRGRDARQRCMRQLLLRHAVTRRGPPARGPVTARPGEPSWYGSFTRPGHERRPPRVLLLPLLRHLAVALRAVRHRHAADLHRPVEADLAQVLDWSAVEALAASADVLLRPGQAQVQAVQRRAS